jgi:DNA-binding transcriptional regulator YiaG
MSSPTLETWRKRLGKSQSEMAFFLGVATATYVQWESGRREPPAAARRLFSVLQMLRDTHPRTHAALAEPPEKGQPGRPKNST